MKHIIFVLFLCSASFVFAQEKNDASIDEIEGLFNEEAESEDVVDRRETPKEQKNEKKEKEPEDISDLKRLETFEDIAVIQKRYLPKTKRFEFHIGGGTNLNDAFFVGNGLTLRLGYNLAEKWGVEGIYSYIQNDNRDVTNSLLKKGVNTEGSVSTDGYYGVDVKWSPIYGKYAYFNEKIIPFDLHFTLGAGFTDPKFVNSSAAATQITVKDNAFTVKIGTGQIFAITKWMAFRWDIAMHLINAETTVVDSNNRASTSSKVNNNLFLNLGLSFFFPEAKYR